MGRSGRDVKEGATESDRSPPLRPFAEGRGSSGRPPPFAGYFRKPSRKASPIRRAASVMVSIMSFAPSA